MSVNNPGIIYDATNSWNGYNHQGKIALWYAISEITRLYNPTITIDQNKAVLNNYFLEIEYMEDFSIGKTENGTDSYISVHHGASPPVAISIPASLFSVKNDPRKLTQNKRKPPETEAFSAQLKNSGKAMKTERYLRKRSCYAIIQGDPGRTICSFRGGQKPIRRTLYHGEKADS